MNRYVVNRIDYNILANDLDDNLGSRFVGSVDLEESFDRVKKVDTLEITVSAEYCRQYTDFEPVELEITIEVSQEEVIASDDPLTLIQNLLVKEYNRMVANILEEEMNDTKKEYENFKC